MKRDDLFTILNEDVSLRGMEEYERELVQGDRNKMNQIITVYDIEQCIKDADNCIRRLCIPFTNIPWLFFSKLERRTVEGYVNNKKMFNLYLEHFRKELQTLKELHYDIAQDLKSKDKYNKLYSKQIKNLTTIHNLLKSMEEKKSVVK